MDGLSGLHKKFFIFMLILLAGVQTSCGFQPRGATALPGYITPVYVDLTSTDDALGRELSALLSASDESALAASAADAKSVLVISNLQKKQRVVAVDNRGRAHEYELKYQFRYELKKVATAGAQAEIIKTNAVELKRDLLFDPDNVLAVGHEKDTLYEDMRKDAARVVLRQLSAIRQPALPQP